MGLCVSVESAEAKAEREANSKIDQEQKQSMKSQREIIKLLLLGAGESGKSTIFKQLRLVYGKPWGKDELDDFAPGVRSNVLGNMLALLKAADRFDDVEFQDGLEEKRKEFIQKYKPDSPFTEEICETLPAFWEDPAAAKLWQRRSVIQVLECLEYYMKPENFDRIIAADYIPAKMDILQARIRTTGIVEDSFLIDGVQFDIFDVGGQRNERKKWIHAFEGVTAVIFVAAISEYDQVIFEDNKTNRHREALKLFQDIANSKWFIHSSIILFLNKDDLFRKKLKTVPFRLENVRFEDFQGPHYEEGMGDEAFEECVQAAQTYLKQQYFSTAENKSIYCHITCATDTEKARVVFDAVKDTVLNSNLKDAGLAL